MSATLEQRARDLYVPGIVGYKSVAKILGVSETTVRRWLNPAVAEASRQRSAAAKRRRTGTCERCGGETRYNGHTAGVSRICDACHDAPRTHCAQGHELTPENRLKVGNEKGGFTCRTCRNDYMREYQEQARRTSGVLRRRNRNRPVVMQAATSEDSSPDGEPGA